MIIQEAIQQRHSKPLVEIQTQLRESIVNLIMTTIWMMTASGSLTKTITQSQIGWMQIWVVPLHRITLPTSWLVEMH